jgi:sulfate permease, SulP family
MGKFNKSCFTPKLFSILKDGYGFSDLRIDVLAGLTVAVVALPLAMALGIACGASPEKGLITAVVAGFLISLFGGSRVQIGGPTGAFVVVVFNIIAQYGYEGLLIASLLAGLILILAGFARFGKVIKFIPQSVMIGFTAGIAVIIASTQVKDFLGLHLDNISSGFVSQWQAYFSVFNTVSFVTLSVGMLALLAIILLRKFVPRSPGYLIVMLVSSLVVFLLDIPVETVGSRFPDITSGITLPQFPVFTINKIKLLLPSAFTIAFLAGIEALLSAMVADSMTGFKHRSNQELIGLGIANIGSAFFGGLPATGAIARTATNIASGGKTPVSGIIHAIFILIFMFFGMDIMKYIPMAVLAAILYLVAWGMSEVYQFIRIFRLSSTDRFILILTINDIRKPTNLLVG